MEKSIEKRQAIIVAWNYNNAQPKDAKFVVQTKDRSLHEVDTSELMRYDFSRHLKIPQSVDGKIEIRPASPEQLAQFQKSAQTGESSIKHFAQIIIPTKGVGWFFSEECKLWPHYQVRADASSEALGLRKI